MFYCMFYFTCDRSFIQHKCTVPGVRLMAAADAAAVPVEWVEVVEIQGTTHHWSSST